MTTSQKYIALAGIAIQVAGTFLLAVEAIKTDNLAKLRTGLFKRIVHQLRPRYSIPLDATPEQEARAEQRAHAKAWMVITCLGALVLLGITVAVGGTPSSVWSSIKAVEGPGPAVPDSLLATLVLFVALFMSMVAGFFVYKLILFPFNASYSALDWIERNAGKGTVGIFGFAVFLVGSLVSAYVTWVAA